jgi:hypothetical protein
LNFSEELDIINVQLFVSDCPASAPTDAVWAVISFLSGIEFLLHAIHDLGNHLNGFQENIADFGVCFNPFQLLQNCSQLSPESFVDSGIALDNHITAQEPVGDIVLFAMSGKLCEGIDEGILLFRYPESDGSISPTIVAV